MQWLTADIVFDGYDFHTDFFIQVDENGEIKAIHLDKPDGAVKKLDGMLMPGMVNAHCHLELSHTKGKVEEKTGLSTFLQNVSQQLPAKTDERIIQAAMHAAEAEMWSNGILAVGDICNTVQSIALKQKSKLHFHNFIECIAIRQQDAEKRFEEYKKVFSLFDNSLIASLALHTPYTCNEGIYNLVNEHSSFISIHNQESVAENLLFEREAGEFDDFYKHFGLSKTEIIQEQTNTSSFQNTQRILSTKTKKLFVHNTFTRKSDLQFADENSWFCFCPKANLYIEDQLPELPIFMDYQEHLVLGTDSLASNDALNILSEVKTIQDYYPEIPLNKILAWATINGAKLFGLESKLGSFEVGKLPGFVMVENFDSSRKVLLDSRVVVI